MKKTFLLLIAVVLLIISACQPRQGKEQAPQEVYRYGTQGLFMRFVLNLPPARLFDNEDFNAVIEIENRGTFDVGGPGDNVYLSGFDPTIITGISTFGEQIPLLEGRDQFTPVGGFDTVSFKGIIRDLTFQRIDRYPARMLATACYGYQTTATANMCIDPNPYTPTVRQKVCVPQNVGLSGGQGAPVAVNLVEVDPAPGRARFKITVQNVGAGEVFRHGVPYLQKCSPYTEGLEFDEIDYVELGDIIVSGISIKNTCKPLDRGHIRLTNGIGIIYCELQNIRGQAAFMSPMTINLRYGYRDIIFSDVQILPSG